MRICLTDNCQEPVWINARPGLSFAQAIWLSPCVKTISLCGGIGLCGHCAIRFLADAPEIAPDEDKVFTEAELAGGWRLGCRHHVPEGDKTVFLRLRNGALKHEADRGVPLIAKTSQQFFLGLDLGTTSIEWRVFNKDESRQASEKFMNPQAGAGADIIARLAFARGEAGRKALSDLAINAIDGIIRKLETAGMKPCRMCVAGNTAMTEILFGKDISGLCAAPYHLAMHGGEIMDLSLPSGNMPCLVPPLPAPFVGGDLSAGLYALRDSPLPMLMADLGTNAELALRLEEKELYLASVPLGPAMEGIGPRCGQPAGPGVAVAFSLCPEGLKPRYIPPGQGRGISATGYLSLLARLLEMGIMDRHGHFCRPANPAMPLAARIAANLGEIRGEPAIFLPDNLFLTANDVEMLLKVRAAFSVAVGKLLAKAGIAFGDLAVFQLTGAIAAHGSMDDLAALGFIPPRVVAKTRISWNLSLQGACGLALHPENAAWLNDLSAGARVVNLVDDADFLKDYMAAMTWK